MTTQSTVRVRTQNYLDELKYVRFDQVDPEDFLAIANEPAVRAHLVDHPFFDGFSIRDWVNEKQKLELLPGCRIRAVYIREELAGWCGIQPFDNRFELAIVLSRRFWGNGLIIYRTLMQWAKEFGHHEVLFHLLESRPGYRSIHKVASHSQKTCLLGRWFTTYTIAVGNG
ncbi:MAG: GNAT family N-acetyltransferase [Acidiferrobacterales bacterium]|nr:GNAT family N-acetyltransferase [Acidiferrobacterales bacterium]